MPTDSIITTGSASGLPLGLSSAEPQRRLRVLFLSRYFPNNVFKLLGLWVEGLVRHCAQLCECNVISPVPYCPPIPGLAEQYSRFREVPPQRSQGGVEVYHPKFVVPPGNRFQGIEGVPYYLAA